MASIYDLFSNPDVRAAFETVVNSKKANLRTVREHLNVADDRAKLALDRLLEGGLLEQLPGALPDFDVYFPSVKGLAASRQIRSNRNLYTTLY